jgi:hypothetical protein
VAISLALLFRGLRARIAPSPWPGVEAVALAAVAAAYAALLLHTLVYAAYLEDPLTWALLAIAAALRQGTVPAADAAANDEEAKGGLSPLGVSRA